MHSTALYDILDKVFYRPSTVQDETNRKRRFTDHESLHKTLLSSSSYFSYGLDQPPPSAPSYKVVPVICHLKKMGNDKLPLQSHCLDKTLNVEHVSGASKHPRSTQGSNLLLDSFFKPSQSKHDKSFIEFSVISGVVAEEVENLNSSCRIGQFQSSGPQTVVAHSSNTDNKDQCVHSAYISSKHLSTEPASDAFNDKKSHNITDNNSETRVHAFSQHMTESHKRRANSYLDNSSNTVTNDTMCEKTTSDRKTGQYYAPTSEIVTMEKVALGEESQKSSHNDCCEFSKLRKDCINAYQGHVRFHCLPESNDSDSNMTYPGPNEVVKDSSEVLETIDVAEILLSTIEGLKSGPHSHSKTRRFQCSVPECEKAFSKRGSLNRHMRSHLGIRPYSCPLCTMTFSRQYRVTEHMRVHQRSCDDPP